MYSIHLYLFSLNFSYLIFQAPQPSSFDHFWHLVIQEKVEVILMVTQLVEGFNRRADQFWPEQGEVMVIGGGIKVTHTSSHLDGNHTTRQFVLLLEDGAKREIWQVQPEDWADLRTSDGPRQLFGVLQETDKMWRSTEGPLMFTS